MPLPQDQSSGVFQATGIVALTAFLFLTYSRVTDVFLGNLYLPLIASLIALLTTIGTGGLARALTSRAGIWLSIFTIWLVLCVPFSFWPGGSTDFLINQWSKSFLVFVIVAGTVRTVKHCRAAMYAIAGATVVIVVMCATIGTVSAEGRLVVGEGVLSNPNDLAQLLLMGVPFLLLMAMRRGRVPFKRSVAAICIGGVLLVTAATGSRGALTALACLIVVMFMNFSWGSKGKLLGILVLLIPVLVLSLSTGQRQRYLTIFGGEPEATADVSAIESTQQRLFLLKQSIQMTLTHPLFGVGPGVFQAASAHESEDEGERAAWRETHNTYTQISSEAGVIALGCYLAAFFGCLSRIRFIHQSARAVRLTELEEISYCLWLSLISFATTSFFNSVAYNVYFPTLAGLAVALGRAAQAELASASLPDDAVQKGAVPRIAMPQPVGFRSRPSASL